MKKYRNLLLILLSFFAGSLVTLLVPVVLAHGGDTNLVHGCVRNNGLLAGFVRIVGATTNCANNETALDWRQGLNEPPFACSNQCDLSSSDNRLAGKNLTNAFLQTARINDTNLSGTIFVNAKLTGAHLYFSNLTNANLTNADLADANAEQANFLNTNLTNATFNSSHLQGAINMNTANLTGATWGNSTICPDGTNSDNNGNTCVGHLTP